MIHPLGLGIKLLKKRNYNTQKLDQLMVEFFYGLFFVIGMATILSGL